MQIDTGLVRSLIADQFPDWRSLTIQPVAESGGDNRTFRLGGDLLVRLPSAGRYAAAVSKEQIWLPRLAAHLPLAIPEVRGAGRPACGFPWPWSVYGWIDGEPARRDRIRDATAFALGLAEFLLALQAVDAAEGPPAGDHNFHRGGDLSVYDAQMREALPRLASAGMRRDVEALWDAARASFWPGPPVWVHGDLAPGNLLVRDGRLSAVIDFGQLGTGDPACDLTIVWTFFTGAARQAFRDRLDLDEETWARARGWAAWKAAILMTGVAAGPSPAVRDAGYVLDAVLADSSGAAP